MTGEQLSRSAVLWQLLAVVLVVLPHLGWLPGWVPVLVVASLLARLMIHAGRWPFPHPLVKLVLVLAAGVGLMLSFGHQAGPETMVALLVVALALKLLEIYHRRDARVVLYVALFLAATAFLFHESVWMAGYILLAVVLILAALNSIQQGGDRPFGAPLAMAGKLLLPALPFMLLLFFLFPRLEPFWSVTLDAAGARTGLSDELSPGDIGALAQSDALAFRASFDTAPPPAPQRYWRALVLSEFDGRRWHRPSPVERSRLRMEKLTPQGAPLEYQVIMEASGRPWLVALDLPVAADGITLTPVHTLQLAQPLQRRQQYRARSLPTYRLQPLLTSAERARYLRLPATGNPRSRALARQLAAEAGGDAGALVQALLARFNHSFVYTLEPGRLGRDPVDGFLFDSRQGYCEHFASATAFVLRSAGIPARVVTGYQGGEWNPYEGYLEVRQYDAHAWVEFWQPELGWQRLDPTAAVAPERIRQSAQAFFRDNEQRFAAAAVRLNLPWLRELRLRYDAFNYAWHRWVLNYPSEQQALLRDWLGGGEYWRWLLAWLLPPALLFAGWAWWLLRARRRPPIDPLQRALLRLQQRLSRLGAPRQAQESPAVWLRRIAVHWPQQRALMLRLAELDDRARYAPCDGASEGSEMLALCRQLLRQLPRRRRT